MKWTRNLLLLFVAGALGGCATMPTGPSVMVLPPPVKPFEVFQAEELVCRNWAAQQTGLQPAEAVNQNIARGAGIGTILGAALGAAIGAASGDLGAGAAIGAASGLVGGVAVSSGPAYATGVELQRRYDNVYSQCMYAKGNLIPGVASHHDAVPPPPSGYQPEPPPPPAGPPPPPPSG